MRVRLFERLLGYYRVDIPQDAVLRAADALLRAGLGLALSPDGRMYVPARRLRALRTALADVPHTVSPMRGMLGFLLRHRRRYGAMAALAVCLLCACLCSRVVWDVRLEGEFSMDEASVLEQLSACGISPGVPWREVDAARAETALLAASPDIAWVSLYRRAGVMYVTLTEKTVHEDPPPPEGFADVIAARDAVIEEVQLKRGYAVVKRGDTVREGDLLIGGLLPSALGGGLCYAEGEVIGRVEQTVCVTVPPELRTVHSGQRRLIGADVNFFGFSLNNLKIYGNSEDGCAIIEEKRQLTLGDRYRLPILYTARYAVEQWESVQTLSEDAMVRVATARLEAAVREAIGDGELLAIRTEGAFGEEGYTMTAHLTYRTVIGRTVPLSVTE